MRRRLSSSQGLTLLEFLLAMVIISLLMTVLYSALNTTVVAWRIIGSEVRTIEDSFAVEQFMRRTIEQALPVFVTGDRERSLVFHGEEKNIEFTGTLPKHVGLPGVYRIKFEVFADRTHERLEFGYQLLRDTNVQPQTRETAQREILIEELTEVSFEYYASTATPGRSSWVSSWDRNDTLPEIIRVNLRSESGVLTSWSIPVYSQIANKTSG